MTRISALTALTSADSGDTLPILDVSATTTKKITKTAFISDIVDGTLIAAQAITPTKVDLSVANAAARTALTGFEGLAVYQKDVDATYIYDGTLWRKQAQWEELGTTTLAGAGDTISITSLPARKILKILFHVFSTGGTINPQLRFNNDSAGNYALLYALNLGAASAPLTAQTALGVGASTSQGTQFGQYEVSNFTSQRKLVQGLTLDDNNASAASSCNSSQVTGKWDNTSAQITRVDLVNIGAGDFAIGSVMTVLGRDY